MRLHRVHIENFRGLNRRTVDLRDLNGSPRPLTVVVGPNRSGKTTFLDAIHLAYESIANAKSPRLRRGLDPDDPTLRPDPTQPIEVTIDFSLHPGELSEMIELEAALGGSLQVLPSDVYTLTFKWPAAETSWNTFAKASPSASARAFRGRALASMALAKKLATEKSLDVVGGIFYIEQARSGQLAEYATRMRVPLRPGPFPRDVLGFLTTSALLDMKWDAELQGESRWSRCKRLFADLAPPATIDDVKSFDEGYDLRLTRDGGYYYSAGTSSGERQVLRLVANLVYARAMRSVILIDEIELNLHARWQRSVLHFCQTGGDDDNQFIVTTHSDTILRYVDPNAVVVFGALEDT